MLKHDSTGGKILFQQQVGSGDYGGVEFDLGVAMAPDGTYLGTPVVSIRDEASTTVSFELEDIVPAAFYFAEHGTDMVSDLKDLVFEYSACALREGCDGCEHRTGPASCEIEERALALGIEVVEV